jgi:hypothetical protein
MTTRVWAASGGLAALVWLVLDGGPAAVGAALLVTAVRPAAGVEGIVLGGGALVVVPGALALDEPAAAVGLVAALAAARLVVAVRSHRDRQLPVLAAVGAALLGLALLAVKAEEGVWQLPGTDTFPAALALAGAAAVLVASTLPAASPWTRVLVVPALVLGVPASDALPGSATAVALAVALLAAAWLGSAPLSLGGLALLAATVPTGVPAAFLLAAAAVLAAPLADRGPAAAVLGFPGAAALAAAVAGGPLSVPRVAAVLALAGTAVLLGRRDLRFDTDVEPTLWPVLGAAAWLLVAPATWDWVGDARIDHWDAGAVLAVLAGAAAVLGRRRLPSLLERR